MAAEGIFMGIQFAGMGAGAIKSGYDLYTGYNSLADSICKTNKAASDVKDKYDKLINSCEDEVTKLQAEFQTAMDSLGTTSDELAVTKKNAKIAKMAMTITSIIFICMVAFSLLLKYFGF